MFPDDLLDDAKRLLADIRERKLQLATAESCTGGLIAGLFTEIPGSSDVVDRGFVTYSNAAKAEMLGVPAAMISSLGAVSREVAIAMAEGAISRSKAQISIAVTGVAGPGGGTAQKPVGLVHLAAAHGAAATLHHECRFGELSRAEIRIETVRAALTLIRRTLQSDRPT
jgi:nicotinamide-nucleotide amidase